MSSFDSDDCYFDSYYCSDRLCPRGRRSRNVVVGDNEAAASPKQIRVHRKRRVQVGPDLCYRRVDPFHSHPDIQTAFGANNEITAKGKKNFPLLDEPQQPFGVRNFGVPYSMNRNKRWEMEQQMADGIESYQRDGMRVSTISQRRNPLRHEIKSMDAISGRLGEKNLMEFYSWDNEAGIHRVAKGTRGVNSFAQFLQKGPKPKKSNGKRKGRGLDLAEMEDSDAGQEERWLDLYEARDYSTSAYNNKPVHIFYTFNRQTATRHQLESGWQQPKKGGKRGGKWEGKIDWTEGGEGRDAEEATERWDEEEEERGAMRKRRAKRASRMNGGKAPKIDEEEQENWDLDADEAEQERVTECQKRREKRKEQQKREEEEKAAKQQKEYMAFVKKSKGRIALQMQPTLSHSILWIDIGGDGGGLCSKKRKQRERKKREAVRKQEEVDARTFGGLLSIPAASFEANDDDRQGDGLDSGVACSSTKIQLLASSSTNAASLPPLQHKYLPRNAVIHPIGPGGAHLADNSEWQWLFDVNEWKIRDGSFLIARFGQGSGQTRLAINPGPFAIKESSSSPSTSKEVADAALPKVVVESEEGEEMLIGPLFSESEESEGEDQNEENRENAGACLFLRDLFGCARKNTKISGRLVPNEAMADEREAIERAIQLYYAEHEQRQKQEEEARMEENDGKEEANDAEQSRSSSPSTSSSSSWCVSIPLPRLVPIEETMTEEQGIPTTTSQSQQTAASCGVCLAQIDDPTECFGLPQCPPQEHTYCDRCWRAHVRACLHRGRVPIPCMDPNCASIMHPDCALLVVDQRDVAQYRRLLAARRLLAGGDFRQCPQCECRLYLGGENVDEEENLAGGVTICPKCRLALCTACGHRQHLPLDCVQRQIYEQVVRSNGQTLDKLGAEAKHYTSGVRCPKCFFLVVKTEGCNHMRCWCGHQFCYGCGRDWLTHQSCKGNGLISVPLFDRSILVNPRTGLRYRRVPKIIQRLSKLSDKFVGQFSRIRTPREEKGAKLRQQMATVFKKRKAEEWTQKFMQMSEFVELSLVKNQLSSPSSTGVGRYEKLADRMQFTFMSLLFIANLAEEKSVQIDRQMVEQAYEEMMALCRQMLH